MFRFRRHLSAFAAAFFLLAAGAQSLHAHEGHAPQHACVVCRVTDVTPGLAAVPAPVSPAPVFTVESLVVGAAPAAIKTALRGLAVCRAPPASLPA